MVLIDPRPQAPTPTARTALKVVPGIPTPAPAPQLHGKRWWEVSTRHGLTLLTYRPTGHCLTVPGTAAAWRLASDPYRALTELVVRAKDPARVWSALYEHLQGLAYPRDPSCPPDRDAPARQAIVVLDSMPTATGIAVFRCVCGGYLTEHGVAPRSASVVRAPAVGFRHLDCCPDCYQSDTAGRAACDLYAEQHGGPWTYDTRCRIVAPAECGYCISGLRVDAEPCGDDDCCGSPVHCGTNR